MVFLLSAVSSFFSNNKKLSFRNNSFFIQIRPNVFVRPDLYTVSHFSYAPLFQGPHFRQKCWNRTFFLKGYLLTIFLFDDIEKNSESLMRIVLLREKHILIKMHMQAECLYFLFSISARHYPW